MTNFQTPQTWLGLNATCYHDLRVLPYASPYIFSVICLILGYLQHVTTRYHQFFKKIVYIYIYFYKFDGNAWEPVANCPKPRKSQRKCTVTHVVMHRITRSRYGNALHYGLSRFLEFDMCDMFLKNNQNMF